MAWLGVARGFARRALSSQLLVGLVVFIVAAFAYRQTHRPGPYWCIDDAAITYSAAYELVDHHSLAPYPEGPPLEGYSNPLVFFVTALLRWLGVFDPGSTPAQIELVLFGLLVVLVWTLLRRITGSAAALVGASVFLIVQLATPATWLWYSSGLENVWLSTGLIALVLYCIRAMSGDVPRAWWGVVPFLVAITRPEAPVYVAAFYGALGLLARPDDQTLRAHMPRVARALAVTVGLYAAFLVWRRVAYDDWLPNTYYAKLSGKASPVGNLRDYVVVHLLPYGWSALQAASVLVLLAMPTRERLALILVVFTAGSLTLPILAGRDWMGEHRFGTPFLTMAHVCCASLVAVLVATLRSRSLANFLRGIAALAAPALLLWTGRIGFDPTATYSVSHARVARLQGGERWEHQMRLGLPNAAVLMPDAGGSLLVGAMQMVDNGFLVDFQMPRIGRNMADPVEKSVVNQYQHDERAPDLVDANARFPFDASYLGTRYLLGEGRHAAWRERVVAEGLDPEAKLLWSDEHASVYLSSATVPIVAPRGLLRLELLVVRTGAAPSDTHVRASIPGGDADEIRLAYYSSSTVERRALLLGAPPWSGPSVISFEVTRENASVFSGIASRVEVTRDPNTNGLTGTPYAVAKRVAWLREQQIPRLGMSAFHEALEQLDLFHRKRSWRAGEVIHRLRWNARLATFESLPALVRAAELEASRALLATCTQHDLALRALCIGQTVDELRRLGYFDVLARVPEAANVLATARAMTLTSVQRYQVLVGISLARPADLTAQRELIAVRRALATAGTLPALPRFVAR